MRQASTLVPAAICALITACAEQALPAAGPLCVVGENIFCRCEGGAAGTKSCLEGGAAFGECGPCEDRPGDPGGDGGWGNHGSGNDGNNGTGNDGNEGGSGNTGGGSTGGGSTGGGGASGGTISLLEYCDNDAECLSGMCRFNYCTQTCKKISECPYPESECIHLSGLNETFCFASCGSAVDCAPYNAPPNQCGYTQAVDNWDVTVCAHWGSAHELMPLGTDCVPFDHPACNLGYQERELVCTAAGVCATGCFTNNDCTSGKTCSAQGSLGTCQ